MGAHGYTAEVLTRIEDLRCIAADWDELAKQSGSPLLGGDWFLTCAEILCAESDLRVVVVQRDGTICAVAPLVVARRDGVEWLEVLGVSTLYEPSGLLYDNAESLHYLLSKIVSLRMPIALDRMPAESILEAKFREVARYRGVVFSRKTAPAAYVCTKGTWEEYFQSLSSQRRYDYQRKRKRTERFGRVGIRIERPDVRAGVPLMLEEVFRVEGAGWKGRSGSGLLANERVRKFMARYSEMACDRGTLLLCFLDVEGQPIATILGIEYAKRFWVLKIGYDEEWARCSPGIQLTMETIRYAFEQGLEAYEFLGSEEPWQSMWPRWRHELMSLVLYPMSVQGLSALGHGLRRFLTARVQRSLARFS
jgi:CelD/BcsL family acetyltransferase involved in cellulose biosynthesis